MDNYQRILTYARSLFLSWDQQAMIDRCHLESDMNYIYLRFLSEPWRISRTDGVVSRCGAPHTEASFTQALSIYDYLCRTEPLGVLSGRYCLANSLPHVAQSNPDTAALHRPHAACMQAHLPALKQALASSFQPYPRGDAACLFPVFDGFNAVFQFWEGDEDFPPSISFLWDENSRVYLKYETLYYVMDSFIDLLKARIAEIEG